MDFWSDPICYVRRPSFHNNLKLVRKIIYVDCAFKAADALSAVIYLILLSI